MSEPKQSREQEIAESFINGNISWCREQFKKRNGRVMHAKVAYWLREYAPNELESFLRLMGED